MTSPKSRENALLQLLIIKGPTPAKDLLMALGISQATFSRLALSLSERVMAIGKGRATQYLAIRTVKNRGNRFPLFEISSQGECLPLGDLLAFYPRGYALIPSQTTEDPLTIPLIWPGIPYFLTDSRPQGFIGRTFSQTYPELNLPSRITDWSENDFMEALSRRGEDTTGNLLVGYESFERYQQSLTSSKAVISKKERGKAYLEFADSALKGINPGSSAAGEQPKFIALTERDGKVCSMLVKFSPLTSDPAGRRWRDLLVCEAIALDVLKNAKVNCADVEVLESGNRLFLESKRFDRIASKGRLGLISLGSLDDEWFGEKDHWTAASVRLERREAISHEDARHIRLVDAFGSLIANTDRHFGNLSFHWDFNHPDNLKLAPIYDMLPMLYAPVEGQVLVREFKVPSPRAEGLAEWKEAFSLAIGFWNHAYKDKRISPEFRNIALQNLEIMKSVAPLSTSPLSGQNKV